MRTYSPNLLGVLILFAFSPLACGKSAPKSIQALRDTDRDVDLVAVGDVEGGSGFTAELYKYQSAGLNVHAMVARPQTVAPERGWPVVIFNHGHHPEPEKFGITIDGKDHRPGDYYRRIPELYVERGYLVVMPDYRGHSNSEGFEFTDGMLESAYYTEDVLNLIEGLSSIVGIDHGRVFMMGHSMGGEVTLRALLATDKIRAASMWSSVGGDVWDQAYYYARSQNSTAPDSSDLEKKVIIDLRAQISELTDDYITDSTEPLKNLSELNVPVIIHHAVGDRGAAYKWSEDLSQELYVLGKPYEFWSVQGDAHLFLDADMRQAADRDDAFFQRALK